MMSLHYTNVRILHYDVIVSDQHSYIAVHSANVILLHFAYVIMYVNVCRQTCFVYVCICLCMCHTGVFLGQ